MQGKVKWFDPKLGYGFIISNDGKEIFVHYSGISMEGFRKLKHGQEVEFDVFYGNTGKPQAKDVHIKEEVHSHSNH
ncbi:MAG: cold shock domain-containing protein [bacterium]